MLGLVEELGHEEMLEQGFPMEQRWKRMEHLLVISQVLFQLLYLPLVMNTDGLADVYFYFFTSSFLSDHALRHFTVT